MPDVAGLQADVAGPTFGTVSSTRKTDENYVKLCLMFADSDNLL